jgi:signal transduction histidine kinase
VTHRIAGEVAADIARQLAEPVRALRDRLGLVVDHLERHVAMSTGPTPYPWRSVQSLRQDLGGAYLEATTLARRVEELEGALAEAEQPPDWFELGTAVDHGLRLANHHIANGIELMIDLGATPRVRGTAGTLALIVAQLVATCADSARALPNSTLSVRTTLERSEEGDWALIQIIDNGSGRARAGARGDIAREVTASWGTQVDAASEQDHGCAFELRLVVEP